MDIDKDGEPTAMWDLEIGDLAISATARPFRDVIRDYKGRKHET